LDTALCGCGEGEGEEGDECEEGELHDGGCVVVSGWTGRWYGGHGVLGKRFDCREWKVDRRREGKLWVEGLRMRIGVERKDGRGRRKGISRSAEDQDETQTVAGLTSGGQSGGSNGSVVTSL
jgi:hypothetical protein